MTTSEAFIHLTERRGWYKRCANKGKTLDASTARSFKNEFKKGKLSDSKITSLLVSAGYKVQPAEWTQPE